jgi:hypothetical protein
VSVFRLSLQDSDGYAFREDPDLTANTRIHQRIAPDLSGKPQLGVQRCGTCRELIDKWSAPLAGIVVKKRKYDIAITYDGLVTVSGRFKLSYESARLSGLDFHQLPDDPEFFAITAVRMVRCDSGRRKTDFIDRCPRCGRFESVVGATPVYLKDGTAIGETEFVRTDLEFGSGDEKHPLLLCGDGAAKALSKAKLKGLDFIPI